MSDTVQSPLLTFAFDPTATSPGTPIDTFGFADPGDTWGTQLRSVRTAATAFRREFVGTGTPQLVSTHDLVTLPYPTRFGLWRAAVSPMPFVAIRNRLIVVRWLESDGRRRTLLFEPSDVELDQNTPYFASLSAQVPAQLQRRVVKEHGNVLDHLGKLGIDPADVDYLVFDHLHTQDVRRWLGTVTPQPDLDPNTPCKAAFPNAVLLVQRDELRAMVDLHPLQRPWYQPETFLDLPPDAIRPLEGDTLLGPGVALLSTPGHTMGNQSLVLNTASGIWVSSENAIAAECLSPEHSRLPRLAAWSKRWQQEVVLNANTLENTAQQYNSLIKEKAVADRSIVDERFLQFFPSSELTGSWIAPGIRPTFTHRAIQHGQL